MQTQPMLTPKQAAARIGVSDSLIYEWCASGLLPHYRFGRPGRRGKILIDEGEFDAFLVSCRQEARPQAQVPPSST
jgi:excisionase family DNA binding protein